MPVAIIHDFGEYKGTARQLAKTFQVDLGTMKGRINRYRSGKIPLERVLVVGKVIPGPRGGNKEWRNLPDPIMGRPENLELIPSMASFDICHSERSDIPRFNGKGWG